jgi:plasmid maintenance system antidote protein VapI
MIEDYTVELSGSDLAQLEHVLGPGWISRLLADDTRRDAVVELAELIDSLTSHRRRADGKGCTCGWNGDNMVDHLRAALQQDDNESEPDLFPLSVERRNRTRPPGELLRIWAAVGQRSNQDVARACGIPYDTYRGILAGSERITDDLARKLEAGTGTYPKNTWLMLERDYRAALIEATQTHNRYPT